MAFTFTVTDRVNLGSAWGVHGTFTSAAGDSSMSLAATTHGLDRIVDYDIKLDTGGLNTERPKVTISSGTITATWNDTDGYSGKFYVAGN